MPLLLALMFGSAEAGNYFMNEHSLIKAVRDGARFAARRPFSDYTGCSTVSSALVTDTQHVVMDGYLSTGTIITPNISTSNVTVTTNCVANAGGQAMKGIYMKRGALCGVAAADGCAQIVTVTAQVPYRSILRSLGFSGIGMNINATSQAAVAGI